MGSISQKNPWCRHHLAEMDQARHAKTHTWDQPFPHEATSEHRAIYFSVYVIDSLYKEKGPLKETPEHAALAKKQGLLYCSLVG